jgi:hypothetical protein
LQQARVRPDACKQPTPKKAKKAEKGSKSQLRQDHTTPTIPKIFGKEIPLGKSWDQVELLTKSDFISKEFQFF